MMGIDSPKLMRIRNDSTVDMVKGKVIRKSRSRLYMMESEPLSENAAAGTVKNTRNL